MTTTAATKELVRRLHGGLMAKGDTAVAEEVLAEDHLDHDMPRRRPRRQAGAGRACGPPVADQLGERARRAKPGAA